MAPQAQWLRGRLFAFFGRISKGRDSSNDESITVTAPAPMPPRLPFLDHPVLKPASTSTKLLTDLAATKAVEKILQTDASSSVFFSVDEHVRQLGFHWLIKDYCHVVQGLAEEEEGQTTANSQLTPWLDHELYKRRSPVPSNLKREGSIFYDEDLWCLQRIHW
jgi:hypothetical protein